MLLRATRSFDLIEQGDVLEIDTVSDRMAALVAAGYLEVVEPVEPAPEPKRNRGPARP